MQKISNVFSKRIINRAIVLGIAIILLALVFTPFARYELENSKGEQLSVGFSPAESIELAIRSSMFLSDQEVVDTDLYYDTLLARALGDISEEKLIKENIMITAMRASTQVRVSVIASAFISIAYIALCLVLLGLAIKGFVTDILAQKNKKTTDKRYSSDNILCVIACLVPVIIFAFLQAFDFGINGIYTQGYIGLGVRMAWGMMACIFLSIVGSLFVCAVNFFLTTKNDVKRLTEVRIRSFVCCALLIVLIISVFLPQITMNIWDEVGIVDTLHVDSLDVTEMPIDDMRNYRAVCREHTDELLDDISLGEVATISTDDVGKTLFHTIVIGRSDPRVLYTIMIVANFATLIFAGLLLFSLVKRSFFGSMGMGGINTFKIFVALSVVASLVTNAFVLDLADRCLYGEPYYSVEFKTGLGAILMLILTVCTIVLKLKVRKKNKTESTRCVYDDADVSYAPYVVDEIK